jgi:YVTN family beta-propeller protein
VVANNKIYVANSGGLDFPNYDKTVSVINPETNTVIKTITVVVNPNNVTTDGKGNVYVLSIGDYNTIGSNLAVIDDNTDVIKTQTDFDASAFTIVGGVGYFLSNEGKVGTYDISTQKVSNADFISDGTAITNPYSINADASTGEVFVTDAKDFKSSGSVYAFDKNGKKGYSFTAGINPGKVALLKK